MRILKFSAAWCGPCKTLSKVIATSDLKGHTIEEIDVDTNCAMTKTYNVRAVPTLVAVDADGAAVAFKQGALTAQQLNTWIGNLNAQ